MFTWNSELIANVNSLERERKGGEREREKVCLRHLSNTICNFHICENFVDWVQGSLSLLTGRQRLGESIGGSGKSWRADDTFVRVSR